ncbi:hypothetical protein, partial [Serratia sp. CY74308]|uniref:hypothetical protein n=1 Tax=Serratia sp. CY74308 TaxID=3383675 RepID=UPI003F9F1F53
QFRPLFSALKTQKNAHLDFQKICATAVQNVDFSDKKRDEHAHPFITRPPLTDRFTQPLSQFG